MKVVFECEKCGHSWDMVLKDGISLGKVECVNCSKLTYGPLTEEMVAEALGLASMVDTSNAPNARFAVWEPDYKRQARFVLRLLKSGESELHDGRAYPISLSGKDWRNWLLNLARQK